MAFWSQLFDVARQTLLDKVIVIAGEVNSNVVAKTDGLSEVHSCYDYFEMSDDKLSIKKLANVHLFNQTEI